MTHTNNPTHTRTMKCPHSNPLCDSCKKELDAMYPTEQQKAGNMEELREMVACMPNEDQLTKELVGFANELLAYDDRMTKAGSPVLFIHKYVSRRKKRFESLIAKEVEKAKLEARIDELEQLKKFSIPMQTDFVMARSHSRHAVLYFGDKKGTIENRIEELLQEEQK